MSGIAGRTCPIRYQYGAETIARLPIIDAKTLYVVGGLYGNLPALDTIEDMAARERGPVTLLFKGDFNWFNVDEAGFAEINSRVLAHHAIAGNVEAELGVDGNGSGCGCAYPEYVDNAVVERSNLIHARLKQTASHHPRLLEQLGALPMIARVNVGWCRIGVVHGDADSLAGWRFDVSALDDPENQPWIVDSFKRANVDIFASTHTCLPALRCYPIETAHGLVINNGAAGMPNFSNLCFGVLTRIGISPPIQEVLYGVVHQGVHVHALPVRYDNNEWHKRFLANWSPGSPAWLSYHQRIVQGPKYSLPDLDDVVQ